MKKIVTILMVVFSIIEIACADVLPYYINSQRRYGIGYSEISSPLIMRQTPDKNGKILETLNFDYNNNATCEINKDRCTIDEIFIVYSVEKKISFMTTIDSTEGYNLVCFNQSQSPVCGWIEDKNTFYSFKEFIDKYGKKYGLYLYKDLQKSDKILYAAPTKQTNSIGSIEMPKYIAPWLIRGNWVLIKVDDFASKQQKTGWFNYRGDNGRLKLFVKF